MPNSINIITEAGIELKKDIPNPVSNTVEITNGKTSELYYLKPEDCRLYLFLTHTLNTFRVCTSDIL